MVRCNERVCYPKLRFSLSNIMSVYFWQDFIYAVCAELGGRIKGLQFSVFKGGPGWHEYMHLQMTFIGLIWRGGPGTQNQMIKCPLFLTEQISHTQMQMDVIKTGWERAWCWEYVEEENAAEECKRSSNINHENQCRLTKSVRVGGVSHFQSLGSGHNIFLPGCWARHEDWLTRSWLLKCSCPGWGRPGHRSHFISWLTEGAQFACFL